MKEYICQSCGAYLEPKETIQYRDEEYDELYITCPFCGGDCTDPEFLEYEDLDGEECLQDCEDCVNCLNCEKRCTYAGKEQL